jgi:RecG-like helicase
MGWFRRVIGKLAQSELDRRADQLRDWAEGVPQCTRIGSAQPRSIARVVGVVESLRVRPREGVPVVEAVVSDGTGTVTAVWLGRRSLPGLALGSRLILEGRLGGRPPDLQVVNPSYEFIGSDDENQ